MRGSKDIRERVTKKARVEFFPDAFTIDGAPCERFGKVM